MTDDYILCALCDQSEQALHDAGEQFEVVPRYTAIREMLEREKPDVVFVLVPTDGQTVYALTSARHKCHIITEIPYALTLQLGDAIGQACRESGVKWEVAENVWLWPHEQLKQKIAAAGLLGEITHARLWYPCGSYHGINAIRMILAREPQKALGYVQRIVVPPYTNYGGQPETIRWWESGIIEFEGEVVCLYEMAPSPGVRDRHWEVEGTGGYLSGDGLGADELVLYREGGQVRFPFRDIYEKIEGQQVLSCVLVDTDPPMVWENPFKRYQISHFDDIAKASILHSMYRAVTEGIDPAYGPPNARRDMELWIALRESAHCGNIWMDLPLQKPTGLEQRIHAEYIRRYGADPLTDAEALLKAPFNRLSVMWTVAGWL